MRRLFLATCFLAVLTFIGLYYEYSTGAPVYAQSGETSTTPDCQFSATLTGATASAAIPNSSATAGTPCVFWRLTYTPNGFSALSLAFQGARDVTGTAGTFSNVPAGNILEGANPLTDAVCQPGGSGCTLVARIYTPWVRVNVSSVTGTGTIQVRGFGYRGTNPAATSSGSVASNVNIADVGGVAVPTTDGNLGTDAGQTARSAAAWTSGTAGNTALTLTTTMYTTVGMSFRVSGGAITGGAVTFELSDDGTNYYTASAYRLGTSGLDTTYALSGANQFWQVPVGGAVAYRVRLSTVITGAGTANIGITAVNGQAHIDNVVAAIQGQQSSLSDGLNNLTNVPQYQVNGSPVVGNNLAWLFNFNGTSWDRGFICPSQVEVALSGTSYTQIIAGVASKAIRVCKLFVTSASGGAPVVNTFTVAFGSNCAMAPTEAMNAAGVTGLDSDFSGALRGASAAALCVLETTANSDKVTVTYAQF